MKNYFKIMLVGIIAGAASWSVVSLLSDRFEPFDSDIGFYAGQFLLSVIAFWIGYKKKFSDLLIYLFFAYLGMNAYAYLFGSGEQRAWFILGLITTLFLVFYPAVFGVIGKLLGFMNKKYQEFISSKNHEDFN